MPGLPVAYATLGSLQLIFHHQSPLQGAGSGGSRQAHKLQAAQSTVWQQLPPLWTSSIKALSAGDSSRTSLSLTPNPGTNAFPHREAATPLGIRSLPGLRQQSQKKGDRLFCPRK